MSHPDRGHWPALVAVFALALPLSARALPPQLGGEVALSGWSSNRMLDDRRGAWALRASLAMEWAVTEAVLVQAEAWAVSAPERLDGRREDAGLREASIRLGGQRCEPTLGKRVVTWGKADGINPIDQLSPTNFRRLAADTSDQRSGVWGVHLNCMLGAGRLQTHVLDRFEFHQVPLPEMEAVTLVTRTPSLRPTLAVRYDVLGSGADWSVAAIDGHDLYPTLALDAATGVVTTTATGMRLLGGDVALTRAGHVYRGELAWVDYRQRDQPLAAHRRSHVSAVGQVEWWLADGSTVSVGMVFKQLRDPDGGDDDDRLPGRLQDAQALLSNEARRTQHGATARYARSVSDARGELELFAIWMQSDGAGFVRARYGHAVSDQLRLSAGFDAFAGPADSYLGNLGDNSLAFAELRYAW